MASVVRIDSDDQLKVIADPNKRALLRRLMISSATISQLGVCFDKHPAWIRHHVKAMEAAGLVQLVETRTTRNYTEKYYAASAQAYITEKTVRPTTAQGAAPLVFASSDFALNILAQTGSEHPRALTAVTGSLDSLIALRQGLADIAGCHLLDAPTGDYNVPFIRHLFPDREIMATTLAHREQGLMVASGNPRGLTSVHDLADESVRFVNRNRGSGTRVWLDNALRTAGIPASAVTGYADEVETHSLAAARVAQGHADAALGIRAAADEYGLGFVPLFTERYDLVFNAERADDAAFEPLLDRLHSGAFRQEARRLCGYDTTETGRELDMTR